MKPLLWAFVCALVLVGSWELYARHRRHQMFSGTVYDADGRPLAANNPSPPPPATTTTPSGTRAAAPAFSAETEPVRSIHATAPRPAPAVNVNFTPAPPSGVAFAGIENFEWYQQGDLTWRLNLQSGASCVAFATPEAWHKPMVFQHGCHHA